MLCLNNSGGKMSHQPDDMPTWNEMRIMELEAQVSILKDGLQALLTSSCPASEHAKEVLGKLDDHNMRSHTGS